MTQTLKALLDQLEFLVKEERWKEAEQQIEVMCDYMEENNVMTADYPFEKTKPMVRCIRGWNSFVIAAPGDVAYYTRYCFNWIKDHLR